jgi:hypothetical protein
MGCCVGCIRCALAVPVFELGCCLWGDALRYAHCSWILKRNPQTPNQGPKKALSAYFFFANDKRPEVMKEVSPSWTIEWAKNVFFALLRVSVRPE